MKIALRIPQLLDYLGFICFTKFIIHLSAPSGLLRQLTVKNRELKHIIKTKYIYKSTQPTMKTWGRKERLSRECQTEQKVFTWWRWLIEANKLMVLGEEFLHFWPHDYKGCLQAVCIASIFLPHLRVKCYHVDNKAFILKNVQTVCSNIFTSNILKSLLPLLSPVRASELPDGLRRWQRQSAVSDY